MPLKTNNKNHNFIKRTKLKIQTRPSYRFLLIKIHNDFMVSMDFHREWNWAIVNFMLVTSFQVTYIFFLHHWFFDCRIKFHLFAVSLFITVIYWKYLMEDPTENIKFQCSFPVFFIFPLSFLYSSWMEKTNKL